jgi:hypothetical protein
VRIQNEKLKSEELFFTVSWLLAPDYCVLDLVKAFIIPIFIKNEQSIFYWKEGIGQS